MLRWLLRIVAGIAILVALSVLAPLAYIEGICRPSASAATSSATPVVLPVINEQGYQRKQNNTFFTFPEWYIVYSFEDFGRFLDRSSESHFNISGISSVSGALSAPSTRPCRRPTNPWPASRP
jgi:hypothetical protein